MYTHTTRGVSPKVIEGCILLSACLVLAEKETQISLGRLAENVLPQMERVRLARMGLIPSAPCHVFGFESPPIARVGLGVGVGIGVGRSVGNRIGTTNATQCLCVCICVYLLSLSPPSPLNHPYLFPLPLPLPLPLSLLLLFHPDFEFVGRLLACLIRLERIN
ncbi:hypothetical protein B0F90DRAFT_1034960 [Multifurca ochricompacta]|uniref:Uncharacterized protein n=1 Tax=Multifurca ochricompacta TaxID=376703 RepID=A0AAD4LZK9_9AGAM|nr:hypothetical protein B0F90DRAFT_1034960 [Multifurca ochricompacta]